MSERPPLLFYCQHSVGLGHLTRSYALCAGLSEWFEVVLVCGGALPDDIAPPEGVEIVALPPLGVGAVGRFVSHDTRFTVERAWQVRSEELLGTLHRVRPAVVFVELFPFGRAKFARELVPLLEAARATGAMTACSLRDILVTGRENQERHDERAARLANEHLDAVLVHSDPRIARLEDTFGGELAVPVRYTGYVVRGANGVAAAEREPRVVVSAGGGLVGEPLLRTAIAAQEEVLERTGLRMRAIAGPLMPDDAWLHLQALASGHDGLELLRSVPDLGTELRSAAAAVSQAGYNTTLEVMRAGAPALVVPYSTAEEDEQARRARRLERMGALRVLRADELDPRRLADEIERLADFTPARPPIDVDGARGTCEALWELIRTDDVPAPLVTVSSP